MKVSGRGNYGPSMVSMTGNNKDIPPASVAIHEVVLRDGIQNEPAPVPTDRKLELVNGLVRSGVGRIELSSFVNPRLVPQMADAEALWERVERRPGLLLSALVLGEKSLERAIRCRVPHVGIFVSASEIHSLRNSNRTVDDATKEALRLIDRARSHGMMVRAGVMNAFGCAYEGAVPVDRVLGLVDRFMALSPDEICLADTSGLGHPAQVGEVIARVRASAGDVPLSLHLHNTRGLGLANLWEALRRGVAIFDTSLGGLGGCPFIPGAKGNIATEDTVHMLHLSNIATGIRLESLIEVSRAFEVFMKKEFPAVIPHLQDPGTCET